MEQPTLRLGLLGFNPGERAKLLPWIEHELPGWPRWRVSPFDGADALWIHGRAITEVLHESLTVQTGDPNQPWLRVTPAHRLQPLGFSGLMPGRMEPTELLAYVSPADIRHALHGFEAWLRPLRSQYALGKNVVERAHELSAGVWHVSRPGQLLAVVDLLTWHVGIHPAARPVDFEAAQWSHRPPAASAVPPGYLHLTLPQVMWVFASRTPTDVLPERYRDRKIYFCRRPRVPIGWMAHEHLQVLSELAAEACNLTELHRRTGVSRADLEPILAALYFSGCVTTDRSRRGKLSLHDSSHSESTSDSSLPLDCSPPHMNASQPPRFDAKGVLEPLDGEMRKAVPAPLR